MCINSLRAGGICKQTEILNLASSTAHVLQYKQRVSEVVVNMLSHEFADYGWNIRL